MRACVRRERERLADVTGKKRVRLRSLRELRRDRLRVVGGSHERQAIPDEVACLDVARRQASEVWLGRRDSNPNNLLQRQVSYR